MIARMYNNEAVMHDLTTTMGFVLLNIDSHEGSPSTSIGPLLGMEPTSLSRTLLAMEKKKLIVRKKDPHDGRMVRIMLTEKGRRKREIAKNTVKEFNREISELIDAEKLSVFNEVVKEVTRLAEEKKFALS